MADVSLISRTKLSVSRWLANLTDETTGELPSEGDSLVPNTIIALWKESLNWRQNAFTDRMPEGSTDKDAVQCWRQFRKLEQGNHWEVWGRRNLEPGKEYQHELVDDEIGNQIRVRKSYLTGQWHDLTVFPNINNINEILDQERAATEWNNTITLGVHTGLSEGHAVFMSVLDKSLNSDGIVREIVCDNASIFPTPFCTSFERIDGCWFVIYATIELKRFILEDYPDLKNRMAEVDRERATTMAIDPDRRMFSYNFNGVVDKLVCYCDDDTLENIPLNEEEIYAEHAALHQGQPIEITRDQNHKKHVELHIQWLEEINAAIPVEERTPEDSEFLDTITQAMLLHVEEHIKEGERKKDIDGIPVGKRRKYPDGRKIVVIGNELGEDIPNPHNFDWRKLFHKWEVEKLPGSFFGRGTAEILWNTNKALDTLVCRTADIALAVGTPKPWLHTTDKNLLEDGDLNNDPLEPGYYNVNPPVFPVGQAPRENLEIFNAMKSNASRQQGVNEVSYGGSPSKSASGDLVELLMKQNTVLITGEANQRLNAVIESIVETRLMMWKRYYTEPRYYYINGQLQALRLSEVLSKYKVLNEQGQMEERDIPMFQVHVKPGSNLANQWEIDLAFAIQLYGLRKPDGMPLIPPEAILDIVSRRYTQYGRDSEYYELSEATKLGMQVMSQEAARKKEELRTLKGVRQTMKKAGIQELLQANQPDNGKGEQR